MRVINIQRSTDAMIKVLSLTWPWKVKDSCRQCFQVTLAGWKERSSKEQLFDMNKRSDRTRVRRVLKMCLCHRAWSKKKKVILQITKKKTTILTVDRAETGYTTPFM